MPKRLNAINSNVPMPPESSMTSPSSATNSSTAVNPAKRVKLPDLLPLELLYSIVTLARPSSAIPRTCSQLHSICATGHDIQFSWRNCLLLGDRASRPSPDNDDGSAENAYFRHRSNIENTLASLLQLQLEVDDSSQPSTGFAPTRPPHPDPIFTIEYLRRLYAHTVLGLPKTASPDSIASRPKARTAADIFPALDALLGNGPIDYNWWRPITDALLFPVYFIRASRHDMLEVCLHLIANTPWAKTLVHLELPGAGWSYLSLDHRRLMRKMISILPSTTTYPLLLATFALLEWSLPTLELVLRFFPTLAPSTIVQHVSLNDSILADFMLSMSLPLILNDPDRIIDLYKWLQEHGAVRMQAPLVKMLQVSGVSREAMERALLQVDIPHWIRLVDGPVELVSLVTLKGAVMRCIGEYGVEEALGTLLDRGLVGPWEWGTLISRNVDKWWPMMLRHVSSHDQRREIVIEALDTTISHPTSIPQLARLAQTDFNVDLITMVLDSEEQPRDYQETLVLFTSLIGTPMLPDPHSSLARILADLDTRPLSDSEQRRQELCALTALFYFICSPQAPAHELECVLDLSPARLAILVTAVFIAIALGDAVMLDFMDMDKQMAAAESLVAHARCVLKVDSPVVSARPMFDLVAPGLRSLASDMIRDIVAKSDSQEDEGYWEPEIVKRLIAQLAQLDSQFVALSVMHPGRELEMLEGVADLIPKADRDCARLSRTIVSQCENDGIELVDPSDMDEWRVDSASVSRDALVQSIRRTVVILAYDCEADGEVWKADAWLDWQRNALELVDELYSVAIAEM